MNTGTADIQGFELVFNYEISSSCELFGNYSFQDAAQSDGTQETEIANIADHKANLGLRFSVADLMGVSLIGNWVGDRSVAASNPLGSVDGFFLTNLSITTRPVFNDKVRVNLKVENLFNETWFDPGIRGANGGRFGTVHDQPGLDASLSVAISL